MSPNLLTSLPGSPWCTSDKEKDLCRTHRVLSVSEVESRRSTQGACHAFTLKSDGLCWQLSQIAFQLVPRVSSVESFTACPSPLPLSLSCDAPHSLCQRSELQNIRCLREAVVRERYSLGPLHRTTLESSMNSSVAYAGLCACILWYNITSVNSVGDAQMDVAAGNRCKTDRCLTPAQIFDQKIR